MRKNFTVKLMCMILAVLFTASVFAGCAASNGGTGSTTQASTQGTAQSSASSQETTQAPQPLMEYSVFYGSFGSSVAEKIANNPNDVVTPYIESKFNIKIKDIQIKDPSKTDKEYFSMFKAADTMPDVWVTSNTNCQTLANLAPDQFADLTDYLKDMPNFNKYNDPLVYPRWATNGKHYVMPFLQPNHNNEMFAQNPYIYANTGWAMWAREDILAKTGYTFTPIADLKKNYTDQGKYPSYEDLKIEPAIDTPEKYVEFLKKVKALNLKVGDKTVVPMDTPWWTTFHVSAMYDNGHWRIDDKGNVAGFLGTPGAKPFYKLWSSMYQEGLLDKDYVTIKDDQLQQKIASGLVASGLYIPDGNAARKANLERDPAADIRPIQLPKEDPKYGFFDVYQGGFYGILINKDFPDIKRLTQYYDWFMSDEGMDVLAWGPESAGLWEMKDGKKQFKADVADDILNGNANGKNAVYYGLFDPTVGNVPYPCKACMGTPYLDINTQDWRLNYPIKLDVYDAITKVLCKNANMGVDYSGIASYGDNGTNTGDNSTWYWNTFLQKEIAKLLTAKNDADFDKQWDIIYKKYQTEGKYDAAVADMVKWFQEYGPKK